MSVEFSEVYRHTGAALCRWSPDGALLACALGPKLVVRDAASLQIVHAFSNADAACAAVEWSPDSKLLLCTMPRSSVVQAWSVEDPEWRCRIDGGAQGTAHARWAPDSRHVLVACEFGLRLTVWSLLNRTQHTIDGPKFPDKGLAFTKSGSFMAVATRRDCKDYVAVYSCASWSLVKEFRVCTDDLADLCFAPDDSAVCVLGSCLEYTVSLYALDGTELVRVAPKCEGLGARAAQWAPDSLLLAVGSHDQRVRLVNAVTQKAAGELLHSHEVCHPLMVAYREAVQTVEGSRQNRYEVMPMPVQLDVVRPSLDKPNPPMGVESMRWSPCGLFLASRNDATPNALWVWDVVKLEACSLLVHGHGVKDFAWAPREPSSSSVLALCTGTDSLCFWSPEGCSCVVIPQDDSTEFRIRGVSWNPANPNILLLLDRDSFCCCYRS
eukprot:m51a1_g12406 hypothetical protein (438) ;mRNA; f:697263-699394